MNSKRRSVDLTPTRKGYIRMLKRIIASSTCEEDRAFCLQELSELQNGATYRGAF